MSEMCPVCGTERQQGAEACSACGFKFLGTTQQFEPIKIDAAEPEVAPKDSPKSCQLRVIRGPQIESVYLLGDKRQSIGRDPNCDIFLNDMTVSRKHAFIGPLDGNYVIQDNDSFNGLWVNSKNATAKRLKIGDIIQIGAFCLVFEEQ